MTEPRHIVLATTGSLGDLHPFVALGVALHGRGYRVTIASAPLYRDRVEKAGLGFAPMRPDRPNDAAFHAQFMDEKTGPEFVFKQHLSSAIRDSYDDLMAAVQGADMLVSQSLAMAAPMVASKTGIPWVSAFFQPMTLFSTYDPPYLPPIPFLRRPMPWAQKWNTRLLYYVRKYTARWVEPITRFKAELGLPIDRHPLYEDHYAPRPVLAMFSPLFGTPQPDWPANIVQTGTVLYQHAGSAETQAQLEGFFAAGDAPLVFTLGSAATNSAGNFYAEALQAAQILNRRAILVTTGLAAQRKLPTPLPPSILRIDYAPYEQLFFKAAAIIHSGGIATSFVALQSGKPQIVIPFAHDQRDNAMRIQRLGAGRMLPRKLLNAPRLAATLYELLSDASTLKRAIVYGETALAESGTNEACDSIERVLADA